MEKESNDVEAISEELTSSTTGNINSGCVDGDKEEKNDLTPSSSTDASTPTPIPHLGTSEDPISSTSETPHCSTSEMVEAPVEDPTPKTMRIDTTCIVSENDLIAMNITDTSTEKITENVDDIVQDLENLLGEPTTSFDFTPKPAIKPQEIAAIEVAVESSPLEEVPRVIESSAIEEQSSMVEIPLISEENPPKDEEMTPSENVTSTDDTLQPKNDKISSESQIQQSDDVTPTPDLNTSKLETNEGEEEMEEKAEEERRPGVGESVSTSSPPRDDVESETQQVPEDGGCDVTLEESEKIEIATATQSDDIRGEADEVASSSEQVLEAVMSIQQLDQVDSSSIEQSKCPTVAMETVEAVSSLQEPLVINVDENVDKEKSYYSPRITIKPIVKSPLEVQQEEKESSKGSLKMTITKQDNIMHSILKIYDAAEDSSSGTEATTVPKLIIKSILPQEHSPNRSKSRSYSPNSQRSASSPRITIKPIVKPPEETINPLKITLKSPKLTIKPIVKSGDDEGAEGMKTHSPRITIKPIVKPPDADHVTCVDGVEEETVKQRIVLKINKGALHTESCGRKRDRDDDEKTEKLAKIKVKLSKEGHPHIVQESTSKLEKILTESRCRDDDDIKSSPIVISEVSEDVSVEVVEMSLPPPPVVVTPIPRKRGRPRKVPLEVREDFKDPIRDEEPKPTPPVYESTRPKRSCRGQSVRTTLGIKPRKPRGPGRGRGSKRGMGTKGQTVVAAPTAMMMMTTSTTTEEVVHIPKLTPSRGRPPKDDLSSVFRESDQNEDVAYVTLIEPTHQVTADIVMYEEETRMSAETTSRAQTPAKQIVTNIIDVDESQSSVHSSATTESAKGRNRVSRMEVQEPEGAVISADQLAEYYWSGGGPYMLQEQVAQFLGIKSFKRKYPNITRRFVDMQERDFIRESGLAGESMCDLGLTAVNSCDILDIMYSDFQDKYEEYCKHQRDRQAKDLTNKQKALTLAASQEKTKIDITQQAVQSAASWNTNFNKARRSQRKACMDLQTLTIHYPKGKMKQMNKTKLGHYPVALVPGQFTDYYKQFTPTEINNLPINTMCYDRVGKMTASFEMDYCDSQTDDGSASDSDTSTSDSDSSFSGSSDAADDCTLCTKPSGHHHHQGKRLTV